jgi:hypothetical protein
MTGNARARRLARQYPDLALAPEDDRAAIVRRALFHPAALGILLVCAVLVLPPYLRFAFDVLGVESESTMPFLIGKIVLASLLPAMLITFALRRWVMPVIIRGILKKRGYVAPGKERADAD